jgi:hypothetical protein
MGPQLSLRHAVDVNGWAQDCSEMFLSMILDGPTLAAEYIVDDIERAQHCLEMFCQSYWMGPEMPPNISSMLLNGPSIVLRSSVNCTDSAHSCR